MTTAERIRTLTFPTQDYVSRQHGDARIDCYVTEPTGGIGSSTGMILLIHGRGNDGSVSYRDVSLDFADRFNAIVTRVEFRDSGREAHHPVAPRTFDVPYDHSKLQAIDCLRAAKAALDAYPQVDCSRLYLWGGSQGAQLGAQCLVFTGSVWAGAVLCCGAYEVLTYEEKEARHYNYDFKALPGVGSVEYSLGTGQRFSEPEAAIRSPLRHAHLMPDDVPIVLIHGTRDDNNDIRHAISLYARLLAMGKQTRFYAIAGGNHLLRGAEDPRTASRDGATIAFAADVLAARRLEAAAWPSEPTVIPVPGGRYEVRFGADGATLAWLAN